MSSDINRLFSMIKQTNLPYQVFADDTPGVAPREPEKPQFSAPARSANEDVATPHSGLFRAYNNVEAEPVQRRATLLADVFRRMVND